MRVEAIHTNLILPVVHLYRINVVYRYEYSFNKVLYTNDLDFGMTYGVQLNSSTIVAGYDRASGGLEAKHPKTVDWMLRPIGLTLLVD